MGKLYKCNEVNGSRLVLRKNWFAALWTEVCLVFPVVEAIKAGYEVYAVEDASDGTSFDST